MQIECPHCQTTYDLAETAIGPQGRQVRCARCKSVWHAMPVASPAMASHDDIDEAAYDGADEMAEAIAQERSEADDVPMVDSPPTAIEHSDSIEWDDPSDPPKRGFGQGTGSRSGRILTGRLAGVLGHLPAAPRIGVHLPRWLNFGLTGVNAVLAGLCVAIVVWRADIVRLMPQTASFFETIGLGVNLRGLVFTDTAISHETVGNSKVMVIEGAVQAVAAKPVDLPRLRFGVLDATGHEVFSWTAILDQPYLRAGDKAFYKTRLASPPAEARSVLVRFLTRGDVIKSGAKPGHS